MGRKGRRSFEEITGVRLGKAMIETLDRLGEALGRSRSELIREAVTLLFFKYGLIGVGRGSISMIEE